MWQKERRCFLEERYQTSHKPSASTLELPVESRAPTVIAISREWGTTRRLFARIDLTRARLWNQRVTARLPKLLSFRIYRKMLVLKMLGHSFGLFRLDLFGRSVQRIVSFAALGRATHVIPSEVEESRGVTRCNFAGMSTASA